MDDENARWGYRPERGPETPPEEGSTLPVGNVAVAPLTSASARSALLVACQAVGLEPGAIELVRFGENALFRLPDRDLVARVGRSMDAAIKEVHVSRWLADSGFRVTMLASYSDQPIVSLGRPVTFWKQIHESTEPVSSADLGRVLQALHGLPVLDSLSLPNFQPMPKVLNRLDALAGTFDSDTLLELGECHGRIGEALADVSFTLSEGCIHGDAHRGNLMRNVDGQVILIDLEDFMYGPREWDLLVEASRFRPFGWSSAAEYGEFCQAYGYDVMEWAGYETLLSARQLNMTTWLMQRRGESLDVDREIDRRIAGLLSGNVGQAWTIR